MNIHIWTNARVIDCPNTLYISANGGNNDGGDGGTGGGYIAHNTQISGGTAMPSQNENDDDEASFSDTIHAGTSISSTQ